MKIKNFIVLLFSNFICGSVFSQIYTPVKPTVYGDHVNRIRPDSTLWIPTGCGIPSLHSYDVGMSAKYYDSCGHNEYTYDPANKTWSISGGGGGGVGGFNSNKGTGFRFAIPNTDTIKTIIAGYGTSIDSGTVIGSLTIRVDTSSTIQPKNILYPNSVKKGGITVGLENDASSPGNFKYYGTNGSGTRGYQQAIVLDMTGDALNKVPKSNADGTFRLAAESGGGTLNNPYIIRYRPDSTLGAPISTTFDVICDSIAGKNVDFYRDGIFQYRGTRVSEYKVIGDTLRVGTAFGSGERDQIRIWSTSIDTISLCVAASPPPGWTYLDYPTAAFLTESPAHVWNSSNSNWANKGLSATTLTADGSYKLQYNSSSDNGQIIGWNSSNTNDDYTAYEYGVYLSASGAIWKDISGTLSSASSSVSNGEWVRLHRISGTITIEKSTDGLTSWSVIYTYAGTFSSTLYFGLNVYQTHSAYFPQYQ